MGASKQVGTSIGPVKGSFDLLTGPYLTLDFENFRNKKCGLSGLDPVTVQVRPWPCLRIRPPIQGHRANLALKNDDLLIRIF